MTWWSLWNSGVPISAYRMTTGASGFDPGNLWSPLKRYGLGLREGQKKRRRAGDAQWRILLLLTIINPNTKFYFNGISWMHDIYAFVFTFWALFPAVTLNSLYHTSSLRERWRRQSSQREGAHWMQSKGVESSRVIQTPARKHLPTCTRTRKIKASSWYLLEGVHCGGVGTQREGKLQHVNLDGAEQGTDSLHNQVIVGLVCVCMGQRHTQKQ